MALPIAIFDEVYHVGSLSPTDKGSVLSSYEGEGLSVSLHPDEWQSIARLAGPTWRLQHPSRSLHLTDFHSLTSEHWDTVLSWAEKTGLVEPSEAWKVSWYDSEAEDTLFLLSSDYNYAKTEYSCYEEDPDASLTKVSAHKATNLLNQRMRQSTDLSLVRDFVLVCYSQDVEKTDGIWWEDTYCPEELSCPRGVIHSQLVPALIKDKV